MSYDEDGMCVIYFSYLGEEEDDEINLCTCEYEDLMNHIKKRGFVGSFEEPYTGYIYNLALVKCIHE
jgi:hypothetical protein